MLLLIISIAVLITGILLLRLSDSYHINNNLEVPTFVVGFVLIITSSIFSLITIISVSTKSYRYNRFVVERTVIEQTIQNARTNNQIMENATITKTIIEWNTKLAQEQYEKTLPLFKDFIDDRILTLKPIK